MILLPAHSVCSSLRADGNTIIVQRRLHAGYPTGVNKAEEYSWFYIVALQGHQHEPLTLQANLDQADIPTLTRSNSLLFYSADQATWHRLNQPVWTDHNGLKQYSHFRLPISGRVFLSNTIFYDYDFLHTYFSSFISRHANLCRQISLGSSLLGYPLRLLSFSLARHPRGRILITTGCHPAEPDVIASQAILAWLTTPAAAPLLRHYQVDVLPLLNPDGFVLKSCLTSNGINLYWNFLKDDMQNCPEAYHLWRYIIDHPPLLYLDFHSYVHQYHRHPMPYLKEPGAYLGSSTKSLVRAMDRFLIKQSGGYYRFGKLAMWPDSLSAYITAKFNTIAYTKYHFNLYEGVSACRRRALTIFTGLTNLLLDHQVSQDQILRQPYGRAAFDHSDRFPITAYYQLSQISRRAFMFSKSYLRYYRHRNRTNLFR